MRSTAVSRRVAMLLLASWMPIAALAQGGAPVRVGSKIDTATVASTVGAKTLGSPIIVGLSGFNTAYVIQGAAVVALLAVSVDMGFARLGERLERWRTAETAATQE